MSAKRNLPLSPTQVKALRERLLAEGTARDRAMFSLAVDGEMQGGDLVSLSVDDVMEKGKLRKRITVLEGRSQKRVTFRLSPYSRKALREWIEGEGKGEADGLFTSGRTDRQVGEGTYERLVDDWLDLAGLDRAVYGPQSLRRTRASMVTRKARDAKASGKSATRGKYKPTAGDLGGED